MSVNRSPGHIARMIEGPETLMPFQERSVEFLDESSSETLGYSSNSRSAQGHGRILAHEPGLGKTAIASRAIVAPAIVVCPASLIINWRQELATWRRDLQESDVDIVSYANPHLEEILSKAKKTHRTLICDEVHYIKSAEAKRTRFTGKAIRAFSTSHKRRFFGLSGTLVPNRPIELWPLLFSMGITELEQVRYALKFCRAFTNEYGELDMRGNSNLPELRRLLAPHCLRFTKKQVMPELPDKTWRVIALDLAKSHDRREKEAALSELRRMSQEVAFEAYSDLIHQHGLRKLTLAIKYIRDAFDDAHEVNSSDDPSSNKKIIVFVHHTDVGDEIFRAMLKDGKQPLRIKGGMSAKQKQAQVKWFQERPENRVMIGQIEAAGVGHTMTAANHVIFVEGSWVNSTMEQAADRAHRIGQKDNVTCDVLTIDGSIDEHMMRRCLEKRYVVEQIVPDNIFEN